MTSFANMKPWVLCAALVGCASREPTAVLAVAVPQSLAPLVTTAFVDVTVIPMDADAEHVLPHQTVITSGGHITAVGPAGATVIPAGALRVEGDGTRYLIPGLADMHVHMFDDDEMVLDIANGVTTVRNLHGVPSHVAWRDSIARGEKFGPRMYTSGPILDGSPPRRTTSTVIRTAAEADAVVAAQHQLGYDVIKVYDVLSRASYEAIVAAAARAGMRVVGHVPEAVGFDGLLAVGGQRSVEHVEMFLAPTSNGQDLSRLDPIVDGLARQGVWVDPTLAVFDSYIRQMTDWAGTIARPEMRYVSPGEETRWGWFSDNPNEPGNTGRLAFLTQGRDFFRSTLIRRLRTAGVKLVAGTDAPLPMIVPGFALHDELELLVTAGLTPYEALACATRNAAALAESAAFGVITTGRDADLVLLEDSPLVRIGNTRHVVGTMAQGRWYPAAELQARLEGLARAYGRGP